MRSHLVIEKKIEDLAEQSNRFTREFSCYLSQQPDTQADILVSMQEEILTIGAQAAALRWVLKQRSVL